MAILCRERLKRLDDWQIEILATDLRSKALLDANVAKYTPSMLRNVTEEQRQKFFTPFAETTALQLKPEIKRMVSFRRGNVVEPAFWRQIKKGYDVIICCHLLTHLHSQASNQLIKKLAESIRPGGYLMVSESEKGLIDASIFDTVDSTAVFCKKNPETK